MNFVFLPSTFIAKVIRTSRRNAFRRLNAPYNGLQPSREPSSGIMLGLWLSCRLLVAATVVCAKVCIVRRTGTGIGTDTCAGALRISRAVATFLFIDSAVIIQELIDGGQKLGNTASIRDCCCPVVCLVGHR